MEWNKRIATLHELREEAGARDDRVSALVCDTLADVAEELEQLRKTIAHVEDRLSATR